MRDRCDGYYADSPTQKTSVHVTWCQKKICRVKYDSRLRRRACQVAIGVPTTPRSGRLSAELSEDRMKRRNGNKPGRSRHPPLPARDIAQ